MESTGSADTRVQVMRVLERQPAELDLGGVWK